MNNTELILIHNFRCTCGSFKQLNRVKECICCAEIDCVVAKNNEAVEAEGLAEPPVCITQHPGFVRCLLELLGSPNGVVPIESTVSQFL